MKTKLHFVADICIRINTYREPKISAKELETFKEYSNLLAKNARKLADHELEYLGEQVSCSLRYFNEDKKLNINFDGLESLLDLLESDLITEKLEREC